MLAKPPRYDCYSGDSTEYAWHNKAHSCIMPKNPREAAVEVCFYVSRDFFDCASRRRRHKRRLMLNGKRQKSLDLLFPVVQCIGPRYRRSRSIRCWDFGKRPERKSLLALESISLPFNFLCCGIHKCLPNVFQQRGVVIHKPPFPTLVGRFDRLSCGRKAESVLVIIPGKHRCA